MKVGIETAYESRGRDRLMKVGVSFSETRAEIFKQSKRARNRVGIGLSYRPARLHRLAEFIPWNRFMGSMNVKKYGLGWRHSAV
jgi:hypothetical protein